LTVIGFAATLRLHFIQAFPKRETLFYTLAFKISRLKAL